MGTACVPEPEDARVSDPLDLEFQAVVSHHVGAANQTIVLYSKD